MLGHAKLETTALYTRVSIAKLRAVHAATHPAGNDTSGADVRLLRALDGSPPST
jgi:integrase/recombinase XerD